MFRVDVRRNLNKHCIDVVIGVLRSQDGIKQARHAGSIQDRIGNCAGTLVEDGVVILEKLGFLRILERDENHRVATRRHHPPGQANHAIVVAADA